MHCCVRQNKGRYTWVKYGWRNRNITFSCRKYSDRRLFISFIVTLRTQRFLPVNMFPAHFCLKKHSAVSRILCANIPNEGNFLQMKSILCGIMLGTLFEVSVFRLICQLFHCQRQLQMKHTCPKFRSWHTRRILWWLMRINCYIVAVVGNSYLNRF